MGSQRPGVATPPARRAPSLIVSAVLVAALVPVLVQKASCIAPQAWPNPPHWCFTEIPHLLFAEQLQNGRTPYLQACHPVPGVPCDEYPVLTMAGMRLAAAVSASPTGFFVASAIMLLLAALAAAYLLAGLVGLRALYFAAAPTMILYGFMNWDLLAVAAMVIGIFLFLRRRERSAGVALGLGAAAKLIPALLVPSLLSDGLSDGPSVGGRRPLRSVARVASMTLIAWAAVNLPFALAARQSWWEFFRFNSRRPPDVDSLWSMGCQAALGHDCQNVPLVNTLSLVAFIVGSILVWRARRRRYRDTQPWTMGFALLAIFFLTNKVYSPQFDLFLLPWFALVLPDLRLFLLFEIAGFAVYATRFTGIVDVPETALNVSLLARDAVLLLCLMAYVRRPLPEAVPARAGVPVPATPP